MSMVYRFMLGLTLSSIGCASVASAANTDQQIVFGQLQDYMESAPFADGVITSSQLKALKEPVLIVDTRAVESYQASHIPNAINIDWRFVLSEVKQLPKDKLIVLYCDTGILSSKAQFALRLVGYEQVKVLFNGYEGWKKAR